MTRKNGLYLKDTDGKGHGVFCKTTIRRGEVLEVTPAIILNEKDTDHADKTILHNYTFDVGNISRTMQRQAHMKRADDSSIVIMGVASFCNHARNPNAEILWEENDGRLFYSLKATRNIPAKTEICTSYGKGWFKDRGYKSKG